MTTTHAHAAVGFVHEALLYAGPDEFLEGALAGCLVCEDGEGIDRPLRGRERPAAEQENGRGHWLANQVCDLVQVRTLTDGSVVRLHTRP